MTNKPFRITFDLDNTIFDLEPLYKMAYENKSVKYPGLDGATSYDIRKCMPGPIADELLSLLKSDTLYKTPIIDERIPGYLNELSINPKFKVIYVTERIMNEKLKDFNQLRCV